MEDVENNENVNESEQENQEANQEENTENQQEEVNGADDSNKGSKNVEQLEKELSEMKDKYLRIFAEFDNYRKRTIKEKQDIIKLAAKDTISALLPVVDDFIRAIKVANEMKMKRAFRKESSLSTINL